MKRPTVPLLQIETVLPILEKISILGGLSDKQLFHVFRCLEEVSYKQGEFIFEAGDKPSHVYIVWEGEIELLLPTEDSYLAQVVFHVGQSFGETAVIGIQPHSANALAKTDTRLIVFPKQSLFSFFDTDKELFSLLILNIAREACRRLNKTDHILLRYFCGKAEATATTE